MQNIPFHYIVNICYQKAKNHLTKEEDIVEIKENFINKNPIEARKAAFSFFESNLEILLSARGEEYEGVVKANEQLEDLFYPKTKTGLFPDWLGKKCNIQLAANELLEDQVLEEPIVIFELGNYNNSQTGLIAILMNLQTELNLFDAYNFQTENFLTSEIVYDPEDDDVQSYKFLKVPIDFARKDISPDNLDESDEILLKLIGEGENQIVEFKPSLVYNFNTGAPGISVKEKVAQTLCAFANSKMGGILFIGIRDNGEIQGLEDFDFKISNKANSKDYFWIEFTEMLNQFFGHSLANMLEKGFRIFNGKTIFVVKVSPSFFAPIFLNKKYNLEGEKKFYYRDGASSREIRDVEVITKYCLERFAS